MTEYRVPIYPFPFGTRVFMHKNGVIREAEYRGIKVKDTSICGRNVETKHIFWFGSKLGEESISTNTPVYRTVEDATQEANSVPCEVLDMYRFSLKYLQHLVWDGISFNGWLWDGSKPIKRATRESLKVCEIYKGEITFIDYHGNEYDAEHFKRFYQTAEECRKDHTPKVAMLDDEDDEDFTERKRKEFYEYVAHHCPGFESKINWEHFYNPRSMPENLSEQVKVWAND